MDESLDKEIPHEILKVIWIRSSDSRLHSRIGFALAGFCALEVSDFVFIVKVITNILLLLLSHVMVDKWRPLTHVSLLVGLK